MSDFDDEDMPELTPASSPTMSATSDYDCGEDDNFDEDANTSTVEDKNKPQDDEIVISSSNSSSTLSFEGSIPVHPSTDPFDTLNDVPSTITKEISCNPALLTDSIDNNSNNSGMLGYYNQNCTVTKRSAINMDQINNHMERVNLCGSRTASHSSTINSEPNPTSLYQRKSEAQNLNRPSAIIRPNIHAPSTSKGIRFITGQNRITPIRKHKRIRTAFNSLQLMGLENEYSKTRYIDRNSKTNLASALSLSEKTIKVWFQNRRMKEKKDKADEEFEEIEINNASKRIINDNEVYQYSTNVNFNQEAPVYGTLHYPKTQAQMQSVVNCNPQIRLNSMIMPNYSVYIPNTQLNQPPLINQCYQMMNPQHHPFQQTYIQMERPVFQPQQHHQMQFQQMSIQQARIQQMPVQKIVPQIQAQQVNVQNLQDNVLKTENVSDSSEDNSNVEETVRNSLISRLTFEENSL